MFVALTLHSAIVDTPMNKGIRRGFHFFGSPVFMDILNVFPFSQCGLIDVVPNATSRDEMGRAKINDLSIGFFESKYGHSESMAFQQARLNFIQSMAAYSVACYILHIKDRHNGNIMIDGEGHIVHIGMNFGLASAYHGIKRIFCLDLGSCLTEMSWFASLLIWHFTYLIASIRIWDISRPGVSTELIQGSVILIGCSVSVAPIGSEIRTQLVQIES